MAELGGAFLCADLDLSLEPREDHTCYIANWLKVLKDDNRAVFAAASQAQWAVDFLNGLQPAVRNATSNHEADAAAVSDRPRQQSA